MRGPGRIDYETFISDRMQMAMSAFVVMEITGGNYPTKSRGSVKSRDLIRK